MNQDSNGWISVKNTDDIRRKYRIKVIELKSGVKMYHPQVWIVIDVKTTIFGQMKMRFKWIGFANVGTPEITISESIDGSGTQDIKTAFQWIEDFKEKRQKQIEENKIREQEKIANSPKEISYIYPSPPQTLT